MATYYGDESAQNEKLGAGRLLSTRRKQKSLANKANSIQRQQGAAGSLGAQTGDFSGTGVNIQSTQRKAPLVIGQRSGPRNETNAERTARMEKGAFSDQLRSDVNNGRISARAAYDAFNTRYKTDTDASVNREKIGSVENTANLDRSSKVSTADADRLQRSSDSSADRGVELTKANITSRDNALDREVNAYRAYNDADYQSSIAANQRQANEIQGRATDNLDRYRGDQSAIARDRLTQEGEQFGITQDYTREKDEAAIRGAVEAAKQKRELEILGIQKDIATSVNGSSQMAQTLYNSTLPPPVIPKPEILGTADNSTVQPQSTTRTSVQPVPRPSGRPTPVPTSAKQPTPEELRREQYRAERGLGTSPIRDAISARRDEGRRTMSALGTLQTSQDPEQRTIALDYLKSKLQNTTDKIARRRLEAEINRYSGK